MRSAICSSVGATFALAAALTAPAVMAQTSPDAPQDREEIIITHSRLGPLSDWARMQQHSAEYQRLKNKYDPSSGGYHSGYAASDQALAGATPTNGAFMQESADTPTPPAVKALEDAVAPP